MYPVQEISQNGKNIYYRCPFCREYIISTWDHKTHKIARPNFCRECKGKLKWDFPKNANETVVSSDGGNDEL